MFVVLIVACLMLLWIYSVHKKKSPAREERGLDLAGVYVMRAGERIVEKGVFAAWRFCKAPPLSNNIP